METKIKNALSDINLDVSSTEEIIEQMKQYVFARIHRFAMLKDIPREVIEKNIDKFYDFIFDSEYCANCPGSKNCQKPNPLLTASIDFSSGVVTRTYSPCKEIYRNIEFQKQFETKDFPDEWLGETIEKMDKSTPRLRAVEKYVKYLSNTSSGWIYLNGAMRSGRSYVATVFCNDLAKKNKGPINFINAAVRFKELYDSAKENLQRALNKYAECNVLVIDDFGNEYKNDFVRDAIVYPILSFRASHNLLTIFTSDFTIDEIIQLYSTSKAGTLRAQQIGNLLRKMCGKEINLGEIGPY